MPPRAVLVGLPGTGKTTTGRRLARMLGVPFADSDELIEAADGRTVAAIFAESGEPAFRAAERAAIAAALREFDGVLSLGGGALTVDETRAVVLDAGAPVVLLEATISTLAERVGDTSTRPLLDGGDPAARLQTLSDQRRAVYEAVTTMRVDTTGRTPGQVAAHIAAKLHEKARA